MLVPPEAKAMNSIRREFLHRSKTILEREGCSGYLNKSNLAERFIFTNFIGQLHLPEICCESHVPSTCVTSLTRFILNGVLDQTCTRLWTETTSTWYVWDQFNQSFKRLCYCDSTGASKLGPKGAWKWTWLWVQNPEQALQQSNRGSTILLPTTMKYGNCSPGEHWF